MTTPDVLRTLHASGLKIGLISNSHRCLASFQTHFDLQGLFTVTLSSVEHGYMKPHRSIPRMRRAASGEDGKVGSYGYGDSLTHDVDGARRLGMRGVLVARSGPVPAPPDVPVIQSLRELPALLQRGLGSKAQGSRRLKAQGSKCLVMIIRPLTTGGMCRQVAELEKERWVTLMEKTSCPPVLMVSIGRAAAFSSARSIPPAR